MFTPPLWVKAIEEHLVDLQLEKEIIDLLRQKSRPYLFSNSISPSVASAAIEAFKTLREK